MCKQMPKTLLGLAIEPVESAQVTHVPRMYTGTFDFNVYELHSAGSSVRFVAVSTPSRPEMKMLVAALTAAEDATDLPAVAVSPALDQWQKERLASGGRAFIQDNRNAYLPFAGVVAAGAKGMSSRRPTPLSPQAQRMVVNIIEGTWDNLNAGELALRMGKSRASISKYLAEIEAISPTTVITKGRTRTIGRRGLSTEELLDLFEPYLRSPVAKTIRVEYGIGPEELASHGVRMCGLRALEAFSDLAFSTDAYPTVAIASSRFDEVIAALGGEEIELPWWNEEGTEMEIWSYWDDKPRSAGGAFPGGLESVGLLSLYLSLKNRFADDVRLVDAVEQLREQLCRA